ncbi:MAG: hypothetical protein ACC657_16470 [Thiohalomonadales bacterium]
MYILIYVFGMELALVTYNYFPSVDINIYDYAESIIYLIIVFVGTCLAYYFNGGNKGKEFAGRYFSIGFVVGIRMMVVFVLATIIAIVLFDEDDDEMLTTWYEISVFLILMSVYYWRCIVHMNYVATESKKA